MPIACEPPALLEYLRSSATLAGVAVSASLRVRWQRG